MNEAKTSNRTFPDIGSTYPPRVIVSFSLNDLKQSIPGSADLANFSRG
jgi:hypothetical protein